MHGFVFARDEEARRRFLTRDLEPAWREAALVGNWLVELTPEEATELGERFLDIVRDVRLREATAGGADRALVSVSVLPWLE